MVEQSPCLACEFRDKKRSSTQCYHCEKRVKYALAEGIPLVSGKPGRPLKTLSKMEKKRGRPRISAEEKARRAQGAKKADVQLNLHFTGPRAIWVREILEDLKKIAKKELRRPSEQVLFFLKDGIDRYNAKRN